MKWNGGGFDNLRQYGKERGQTARTQPNLFAPVVQGAEPVCAHCGFKRSSHGKEAYRAGGCCEQYQALPTSLQDVRELAAKHGDNLAIVVNHSGGKDSQRMLGFLREHLPTVKTYVVMADTGFEHVKPIPAQDWTRQQAGRFGLELHVVRNPNKTYLEMVERRGMFPSMNQRQCTSDLKRGPIDVFIRNLPERVIVNCTGIRAVESPKRARMEPWTLNESLSIEERCTKTGRMFQKARTVYNWMPIFEESLTDVLRWHWTNGQPLHPVYVPAYHVDGTPGGYLRRFSCRVCIFATDADVRAIYEHDRQAFDAVSDLETRHGFTMKNGKSLFQILNNDTGDTSQYGDEEAHCMMPFEVENTDTIHVI